MTYSTIGTGIAASCFVVPVLPLLRTDAFTMETSAELMQPAISSCVSRSQWMSYEVGQHLNRLGGLRFSVVPDGGAEKAGRLVVDHALPHFARAELASRIGVATALVVGATGCAGMRDEKTGEFDPFPVLTGLLASIIAFMLGVWVGRSLRDVPEMPEVPAPAVPKGRAELDTLPEIAVEVGHGSSKGDDESLDVDAPFPSIETFGLSKDEADFLSAWVSCVGPAVQARPGSIIRHIVSGFFSNCIQNNACLTDGFFKVVEQLARGYAVMQDGDQALGIESVELQALFSTLLAEPRIIADPRIDRTLEILAGVGASIPIDEHAFVEMWGGQTSLKDAAKHTKGFADAVARLVRNPRLWTGEFGIAFMPCLAEMSVPMCEIAPEQARQMRFALLINSSLLSYGGRKSVQEHIKDAFDPEIDREWLAQIASRRWPAPHPEGAAELARLILDRFHLMDAAEDWSSM
jgi:hypothetical protein